MKNQPLDTKTKIIQTSVKMFNTRGYASVSYRGIATELTISVGHLRYYFKKKEDVLLAVFDAMTEEMDGLASLAMSGDELATLPALIDKWLNVQLRYRFFFSAMADILTHSKKLNSRYQHMKEIRQEQLLAIVENLVQAGYLRPAPWPDFYRSWIELVWFVGTHWIASRQAESRVSVPDSIESGRMMLKTLLCGQATDAGEALLVEVFG